MSDRQSESRPIPGKQTFATTQWSIVLAAGDGRLENAVDALSQLCDSYWYPIYAYVRRRGYSAPDAQDLTQSFFARLLEKESLQNADPVRGRFRSFLLTSMKHFLSNERDRASAQKRGGGRATLSLDLAAGESRVNIEPEHDWTPQRLYERQWALTLLELVLGRLETEYQEAGKVRQFELLQGALGGGLQTLSYADVAAELGLSIEAARQAASRMRKRYRALLREEVARTVADPGEVDGELTNLFKSLEN